MPCKSQALFRYSSIAKTKKMFGIFTKQCLLVLWQTGKQYLLPRFFLNTCVFLIFSTFGVSRDDDGDAFKKEILS